MPIQPPNSHPPFYRPPALFDSWYGKILWNLFSFFCGWEKTIHKELSTRNIEHLAPQEIDKTITSIFQKCHFQNTWFADSKREKIAEEAYRTKNEYLYALAQETERLYQDYNSSKIVEKLAEQSEPNGMDEIDRLLQLPPEGPPDIAWMIKKIEQQFGLTENASRKIVLLKLAEKHFTPQPIEENFYELQVPNFTFNSEAGRDRVLQFLLNDKQRLNSKRVAELDQQMEEPNLPVNNPTPPPARQKPASPSPTPSSSSSSSSAAAAASRPVDRENDRVIPARSIHGQTDDESFYAIALAIGALFPGSTASAVLANKLLPKQEINSFDIKKPDAKGNQKFTISLNKPCSGELGSSGENFLGSKLTFSMQQTVTGSINLKEHKITFDSGCVTGRKPGIFLSASLLSVQQRGDSYLVTVKMGLTAAQTWTDDDFLYAFNDLQWK